MTGAEALSVMNATRDGRDGYGYGDGMYGGWFWIIIILFAFWGNGFNRNNASEVDIDTRFLERDIFNTNQNVSNTACQTQRDVLENRYTNQLCCCETQKEILQNRYDNALQTNTLQNQASTNALTAQMQLAQCCCDLKTAIHAEGEETRALITNNTIQDLRDRLSLANNAITSQTLANDIINGILPKAVPAYPSCSPFVPSFIGFNNGFNNGCGCGCNNLI